MRSIGPAIGSLSTISRIGSRDAPAPSSPRDSTRRAAGRRPYRASPFSCPEKLRRRTDLPPRSLRSKDNPLRFARRSRAAKQSFPPPRGSGFRRLSAARRRIGRSRLRRARRDDRARSADEADLCRRAAAHGARAAAELQARLESVSRGGAALSRPLRLLRRLDAPDARHRRSDALGALPPHARRDRPSASLASHPRRRIRSGRRRAARARPCAAGAERLRHRADARSADLLGPCVESILRLSTHPAFELVIVDNGSREAETFALFEKAKTDKRVRLVARPEPFNFARLNNDAVRASHRRGRSLSQQ